MLPDTKNPVNILSHLSCFYLLIHKNYLAVFIHSWRTNAIKFTTVFKKKIKNKKYLLNMDITLYTT